jgi:hypothetical protein
MQGATLVYVKGREEPVALDACPFCGGHATIGKSKARKDWDYWFVSCADKECKASVIASSASAVAKRWNRRP